MARLVDVFLACLLASALVGCSSLGTSTTAKDSPVVARVDGQSITLDDLDTWIKDDYFAQNVSEQPAAQAYEFRSEALTRMLRERVVGAEAEARGLSLDEVVAAEVAALGPVTDEEVQDFYDENRERLPQGRPYAEIAPQIRRHLESVRPQEAVDRMVAQAQLEVLLEVPRTQIAALGPALGPEDARVTIVEFSDFQCPYCRRAGPIVQALRERYPDDLRVVYRHMPLSFHDKAKGAAVASVCAAQQDRFWEYHDLLFEGQADLSAERLAGYALDLGLDPDAFANCVTSPEALAVVEADIATADAAGISGTPAFFVNGILLSGARPIEDFTTVIDAELARPPVP